MATSLDADGQGILYQSFSLFEEEEWLSNRNDFQAVYQQPLSESCLHILRKRPDLRSDKELVALKGYLLPHLQSLARVFGCSEERWMDLLRVAGIRQVKAGKEIYGPNDMPTKFYVVYSGSVETLEGKDAVLPESDRTSANMEGKAKIEKVRPSVRTLSVVKNIRGRRMSNLGAPVRGPRGSVMRVAGTNRSLIGPHGLVGYMEFNACKDRASMLRSLELYELNQQMRKKLGQEPAVQAPRSSMELGLRQILGTSSRAKAFADCTLVAFAFRDYHEVVDEPAVFRRYMRVMQCLNFNIHNILMGWSHKDCRNLSAALQSRTYTSMGITRQGELGDEIYFVESGRAVGYRYVKIQGLPASGTNTVDQDRRVKVKTFREGDIIGAEALFGARFDLMVEATEEVRVLVLKRQAFDVLLGVPEGNVIDAIKQIIRTVRTRIASLMEEILLNCTHISRRELIRVLPDSEVPVTIAHSQQEPRPDMMRSSTSHSLESALHLPRQTNEITTNFLVQLLDDFDTRLDSVVDITFAPPTWPLSTAPPASAPGLSRQESRLSGNQNRHLPEFAEADEARLELSNGTYHHRYAGDQSSSWNSHSRHQGFGGDDGYPTFKSELIGENSTARSSTFGVARGTLHRQCSGRAGSQEDRRLSGLLPKVEWPFLTGTAMTGDQDTVVIGNSRTHPNSQHKTANRMDETIDTTNSFPQSVAGHEEPLGVFKLEHALMGKRSESINKVAMLQQLFLPKGVFDQPDPVEFFPSEKEFSLVSDLSKELESIDRVHDGLPTPPALGPLLGVGSPGSKSKNRADAKKKPPSLLSALKESGKMMVASVSAPSFGSPGHCSKLANRQKLKYRDPEKIRQAVREALHDDMVLQRVKQSVRPRVVTEARASPEPLLSPLTDSNHKWWMSSMKVDKSLVKAVSNSFEFSRNITSRLGSRSQNSEYGRTAIQLVPMAMHHSTFRKVLAKRDQTRYVEDTPVTSIRPRTPFLYG